MGNNTHVTNVSGLVHEGPDLVYIANCDSAPSSKRIDALYLPTVKLLGGTIARQHLAIHWSRGEIEPTPLWLVFTGVLIH